MHNVSGVSRTETGTTGYLGSYLRDGLKFSGYSISDLADVEQIEVLKGPASVLYGRAQPGGVINLISKKPLDTPMVSLDFTGANDDFARPEFDISGPLFTSRLTYRLNASYQNDFSFIDFAKSHHFFIAPAILWKPTDRTTLL